MLDDDAHELIDRHNDVTHLVHGDDACIDIFQVILWKLK